MRIEVEDGLREINGERSTEFIAHVRKDGDDWRLHSLPDHLRKVAGRAAESASLIGAADWARLAGIWHDLGKYSSAFQARIRRQSGYDPEAHVEGGLRPDHSTAGAIHAIDQLGAAGRVLAYLVAGHHAGLPDWSGDENAGAALSVRLAQRRHLDCLPLSAIPSDILDPGIRPGGPIPGNSEGAHLWLRMLFSCLVDADFLDTEEFMSSEKADMRGSSWGFASTLANLQARFDAYIVSGRNLEVL